MTRRNARRHRALPVLLLFLLAEVAPIAADETPPPEAYERVNAALVENHVLARYDRLAAVASGLAEAAARYCAGPGADGLDTVRASYDDTMDAWMGVQHLRFGPAELFMRASRLYFWPEARGKIGAAVVKLLAESGARGPTAEQIGRASVAAQGLPAVEYLLFAGDQADDAGDGIVPAARCALLIAVTANIRSMADGIAADWRGGDIAFARTVAEPGPENPYFATHREVTLAFFKSLHDGLQRIVDVNLKPVVGDGPETARPRLAESRPSGRSLRNVVVSLEALEALYAGDGGPGLGDLAETSKADPKLDPLLDRAFPMTVESARAVGVPLDKAVADPAMRPALDTLVTRARALKQLVRTRLAATLDVAVGFNALDGD